MRRRKMTPALALIVLAGIGPSGASAEVTFGKDYLVGRWSLEGADGCQVPGAEHVEFRADDTLTLTRGGPADATGFFELSEKPRLDLHLVASPHRISGTLSDYEGRYDYGHLAVFLFDMEQDSFEAIVPFEDEVRRRMAYRCK
jgi:hypothetical protein